MAGFAARRGNECAVVQSKTTAVVNGGGVMRSLTSSAGPALAMLTPFCTHRDISFPLQHNFLDGTMIVDDEVIGLRGPQQAATRYFCSYVDS